MKKALIYLFCILISALIVFALPVAGEEQLYSNVVRLHILANSDSEDDQALKLRVRDFILSEYSEQISTLTDRDEAKDRITLLLSEIEEKTYRYIESQGKSYSVKAQLCEEFYPTREYDGFAFPAGEYLSLKISIGEGVGQNWWCVLFPPMCTEIASDEVIDYSDVSAGLTQEQYNLVSESSSGRYVVKFKMLEILENVFA